MALPFVNSAPPCQMVTEQAAYICDIFDASNYDMADDMKHHRYI